MRLSNIAATAFLLVGACATPASNPAAVRSQIEAAEARWGAAILAEDRPALERLLAAEYRLSNARTGKVVDRAAWLANLGPLTTQSYNARVTSLEVVGDKAVATVDGAWTASFNGPMRTDHFIVEDIWVSRDGRWQVLERRRIGGDRPQQAR